MSMPETQQYRQTRLSILVVAETDNVREIARGTSEDWMEVTVVGYCDGLSHLQNNPYDGIVVGMLDSSDSDLSKRLQSDQLIQFVKDRGLPLVVAASRQLYPTMPTLTTEIYRDGNIYNMIRTKPNVTLLTKSAWGAIYHILWCAISQDKGKRINRQDATLIP